MSKKLVNNHTSAKKCTTYSVFIGLFSGALALPAFAGGGLTDLQITQLNVRVLEQQQLIETQKRELEELKNQIAFEQKRATEAQATQTDLAVDCSVPNINNATNCVEPEVQNLPPLVGTLEDKSKNTDSMAILTYSLPALIHNIGMSQTVPSHRTWMSKMDSIRKLEEAERELASAEARKLDCEKDYQYGLVCETSVLIASASVHHFKAALAEVMLAEEKKLAESQESSTWGDYFSGKTGGAWSSF